MQACKQPDHQLRLLLCACFPCQEAEAAHRSGVAAVFLTTLLGAQGLFHRGAYEAKNEHLTKQPDSTGAHLMPLEDDGASSPIRASWAIQPPAPILGALTEATVGGRAIRITAHKLSITASSSNSTEGTLVDEALDASEASVGATSDLVTISSITSLTSTSTEGILVHEAVDASEASVGAASDLVTTSSSTSLASSAGDALLDEALEVCRLATMHKRFAHVVRRGASCTEAVMSACRMRSSCHDWLVRHSTLVGARHSPADAVLFFHSSLCIGCVCPAQHMLC